MLVENTEPRARSVGNLTLLPGVNKVDDVRWDALASQKKWAKALSGLQKDKVLILTDSREKLKVSTVEKTLDIDLLRAWLDDPDHKGPVKGAIKKQLKLLEADESGGLL